jgi:predicted DNA-binding transcriptional regulator AlpA
MSKPIEQTAPQELFGGRPPAIAAAVPFREIEAIGAYRARGPPDGVPNRVRSLRETAALAGISLPTLRRRISDGSGPRVVRMSIRRVGVTDRDREAWLARCAALEPAAEAGVP